MHIPCVTIFCALHAHVMLRHEDSVLQRLNRKAARLVATLDLHRGHKDSMLAQGPCKTLNAALLSLHRLTAELQCTSFRISDTRRFEYTPNKFRNNYAHALIMKKTRSFPRTKTRTLALNRIWKLSNYTKFQIFTIVNSILVLKLAFLMLLAKNAKFSTRF